MILGAVKTAPEHAAYWDWQEQQPEGWETIQAGKVTDGLANVRYLPTVDNASYRIVWISEANAVLSIEPHSSSSQRQK